MKSLAYILIAFVTVGAVSCKSGGNKLDETPTRGNITVLVDETFYPMVDGQVRVFESQYKYAKINILIQPEQEIAASLIRDSSRVAILSRELTANEQAHFSNERIIPRTTEIGYDAIALIVNKNFKDSLIKESDLQNLLTGKANPHKYTLVFDNPRSSTVQYMMKFADTDTLPATGVYSVNSNSELIKYIAENNGSIGFVGVDWLYESDGYQHQYIDNIKVLAVADSTGHHKPTQNDIAEGTYPFIRKLRIINCQGSAGLGTGFASFLAGDIGQRIILKAGLVPANYPKREIVIRKQL